MDRYTAEIESIQEAVHDLLDSDTITMHVALLAAEKNLISREERNNLFGSGKPFSEGLGKIVEKLEKLKLELKQNADHDNLFQKFINLLKGGKAK